VDNKSKAVREFTSHTLEMRCYGWRICASWHIVGDQGESLSDVTAARSMRTFDDIALLQRVHPQRSCMRGPARICIALLYSRHARNSAAMECAFCKYFPEDCTQRIMVHSTCREAMQRYLKLLDEQSLRRLMHARTESFPGPDKVVPRCINSMAQMKRKCTIFRNLIHR
jgi:hypothetical protein